MKIKGKVIINDNMEIVVIPRKTENLVFKFNPVLDYKEFDNYVKEPVAPTVTKAGGEKFLDLEDSNYKIQTIDYFRKRSQWSFLKSMSATEDLEFDLIKMNDPETWGLLDKEFQEAGFTPSEINRLYNAYHLANSMSDERFEEARESFLAGLEVG